MALRLGAIAWLLLAAHRPQDPWDFPTCDPTQLVARSTALRWRKSLPASLPAWPTQPLVRANGLYFADCGLVIQAENTVFRVSRDFLGLHSTIFRDMVTLPTHADAEMMDGAPLVRLPDAAKDVDLMLKALLYSERVLFYPPPLPTALEILSSVLRMSHKYDIYVLRKRALAHLDAVHPTTLAALDALPCEAWTWLTRSDSGPDTEYVLATIVLAREFSLDWILPLAFYRVCRFVSDKQIIDSASSLSSDDKAIIFTGCRILQGKESYRIVSFLCTSENEGCDDPRHLWRDPS
ncbi:hypothetical protein C8F01DRAFT_1352014 [Mycena amicta]|nr:hypothetical protein C8F01DRAFT_1352014 [Mycena amicta]